MNRLFLLIIGFFGFSETWKIVLTGNRTLNETDFELPIYSVIWDKNDEDSPQERFQAYRAWEVASADYLLKQKRIEMDDFRKAMFCYPGRSPFGNGTINETLGSLPECERFVEMHARCLNETEEFLEMLPDDLSLQEALSNNASSFLEMLRHQRNRLGFLIGYYPDMSSPMLSPHFDRISRLIEASEKWREADNDLWAPLNSTLFPLKFPHRPEHKNWRKWNETWNNDTILNFTRPGGFGARLGKLKGNGVRQALDKTFGLNFTDDQWKNLTNLIKNHWKDLGVGAENSTVALQLEEIVEESGASESTMSSLKQILSSGNILASIRSALNQQVQSSGGQFSQLLSQLMSVMKNVHQNNLSQMSQATANTHDLATGSLGTFFGGLQSVLAQLQG